METGASTTDIVAKQALRDATAAVDIATTSTMT